MALIMSIPIRSKADVGYNAESEFTKSYNGSNYGFSPVTLSGLPSGYSFDPDVINYIIERAGKGFNYKIGNESGIVVADWVADQTSSLVNYVFGSIVNAYIATASFVQDYVYTGAEAYRWYYTFTGADESYPGWDTYGTAYGFRFEGICGDKIDIVLDSNGDFYGNNPLGNIIIDQETEPYEYIRIHQGNNDPTDPNIYAPSMDIRYFSDLKLPYIEGKELHFFFYENDVEAECIVEDFVETSIRLDNLIGGSTNRIHINFASPYHDIDLTYNNTIINHKTTVSNATFNSQNIIYSGVAYQNTFQFVGNRSYLMSFNLPSAYVTANAFINYDKLGLYQNGFVNGSCNLYLKSFSYAPNINPNPITENPIPITEIPDDPEDPIPNSDPDPVPGITYPVNPTPPPLRPVPSIVSGNDDLWPSVVELQDIEIDLSGYLASLGDFEFPDLNTITESFAGSIVWVSALMSTLFNGSDFSILFAVLSSFFIVAALLGLYKWWNHK